MEFSVLQMSVGILMIALVMLVSELVWRRVTFFQQLFLPASVIGGILALLLGPQLLNTLPSYFTEVWAALPALLINVVFATLFLGKPVPGLREIWRKAGPQVCFGQSLAWGQYAIGILLAILILNPIFGLPYLTGALIEIGFEGGHGTAAGLGPQFEELGFAEGREIALAMATAGLVMGVVIGTVLINWAARTSRIHIETGSSTASGPKPAEEPVTAAEKEDSPTDPLSFHFGIVGLAIFIGWLLLEGLIRAEVLLRGLPAEGGPAPFYVMDKVPLFPLAMIGSVLIQILLDRTGKSAWVSRRLMNRIGGIALDFTIVAALATLSLQVIGENLVPMLLLCGAGAAWSVFAVLFIAPRIIPSYWFERAAGDFGQSMGVTVTGLLLMRVADPQNKSGALESFGYKQLLFEPVVGGGIFTAISMPLIAIWGPWQVLLLTSALLCFFLIFGYIAFGKDARAARLKECPKSILP